MNTPNPGERTRSVNADLNLVPYIDLLTCMVAFLLITAVWTQLAGLEVAQREHGGEVAADPLPPLIVNVHADGFSIVHGATSEPVGKVSGRHDYGALRRSLERLKATMPDRNDATLASSDDVVFDIIAHTMDTMIDARFPSVSLQEQGGR